MLTLPFVKAGLRNTFVELGYPEGANLALCAATIGLLSGVIFGTLAINWAVRRKYTVNSRVNGGNGGSVQQSTAFTGMYAPADRPSAGLQTVSVDSLDSLALHVSVVGLALLFGYAVKRALLGIEDTSVRPLSQPSTLVNQYLSHITFVGNAQ